MITERGFGSEAAIRRGDRHRHRWGSLAGLWWVDGGLGGTRRGEGGAGARDW